MTTQPKSERLNHALALLKKLAHAASKKAGSIKWRLKYPINVNTVIAAARCMCGHSRGYEIKLKSAKPRWQQLS